MNVLDLGRDVLPYGVFSTAGRERRIGVAVGEGILDLAEALGSDWAVPSLNPFMARGREAWRQVRDRVRDLVGDDNKRRLMGRAAREATRPRTWAGLCTQLLGYYREAQDLHRERALASRRAERALAGDPRLRV